MLHDNEIIVVDSDNKSTMIKSELGSTGATEKTDAMALIEKAMAEPERDIAEGTDLLAGTETETEDTRGKT